MGIIDIGILKCGGPVQGEKVLRLKPHAVKDSTLTRRSTRSIGQLYHGFYGFNGLHGFGPKAGDP